MARSDSLRSQHAELKRLLGELAPWMDPARLARDAATARAVLSQLAGKVVFHLSVEDQSLYPDLRRRPDPAVHAVATRYAAEMGGITAAFKAYLERWPAPAAIAASPGAFVKETKEVAAALQQRMQKEEAELYPLYDRAS